MKNIILVIGLLLSATLAWGQVTLQPRKLSNESKGIVYSKETAVEFAVQTNGWAAGINWGTLKTYYLTRFYYVSIGELKHPREYRVSGATSVSPSYIFGKQNNLYTLRAGLGEKRYLSEKARKKGVAIGLTYRVGPTLGLLKPYYLDVSPLDAFTGRPSQRTREIKYTPETADDFLDKTNITSASGIARGWAEVTPTLGANFIGTMHFGFGAYDKFVRAMDVGMMVDLFFQRTPIMVDSPTLENLRNRALFINLFVNFQLGKRN